MIVVIPALNEAASIKKVIDAIDKHIISEIVVVNNGSTDNTDAIAQAAGATVVNESFRGYGAACLAGIAYLQTKKIPPSIVVFMDADYADHPDDMAKLIAEIEVNNYDMVIGSRVLGNAEKGSLTYPQRVGNFIATQLIDLFFQFKYTDLGPFRAIRFNKLIQLNMQDKTFGWTVEMQIKAIKQGLRVKEIPVNYRKRIGQSKISGTLFGSIMAGYKILTTIFKYLMKV